MVNNDRYAPPKAEVEAASSSASAQPIRLHGLWAMGVATFLGGPFPAGYLIYRNYQQLGMSAKADRSAAWFVAGGLLAMYAAWHTPPDLLSFMFSVGFPQLIAVLVAARFMQGRLIVDHRRAEGEMHSSWFAVAIGIASNLAIKAFFGLAQMID